MSPTVTHFVRSTILTVAASGLGVTGAFAQCATPDGFTEVPGDVLRTIGSVLPERSNAGTAYISELYSPNLAVSQSCTVEMIFVWEGAGYANTIGYFTYRVLENGDTEILSRNLILANASFPGAGCLSTGDRFSLLGEDGLPRIFTPGERVGFFVIADGWNREPQVRSWDPISATIPSTSPEENATFGRGCYTTLSELNPESTSAYPDKARHAAMIRFPGSESFLDGESFLLTGLEDLDRTRNSDDDFNDVVFILVASPEEAIEDTNAFPLDPGDPDFDGIPGADDHYPWDPSRALVTRYPTDGEIVVALEDNYPRLGDGDYNDAVVAYHFEVVTDFAGRVKDILGTFHLVARGAFYDHALGLHLPGLAASARGEVRIERFLSDDSETRQVPGLRSITEVIRQGRRIPDLFPSSQLALPAPEGGVGFANTESVTPERPAASSRLLVTFETALDAQALGAPPYDLYFSVHRHGELWDVHFPGSSGFSDRPPHLPQESGPSSFLDDAGFPWLIEVPVSWRYPLERVSIGSGYEFFDSWRESFGEENKDWYLHPSAEPGRVGPPLADFLNPRIWNIVLPDPDLGGQ